MNEMSSSARVFRFIDQHGGAIHHNAAASMLFGILENAELADGAIVSIEYVIHDGRPVVSACYGDAERQATTKNFGGILDAIVYLIDAIMNDGQNKK